MLAKKKRRRWSKLVMTQPQAGKIINKLRIFSIFNQQTKQPSTLKKTNSNFIRKLRDNVSKPKIFAI